MLRRVEQIIDERSGRMIRFKNPCIVLEDVICTSDYHRLCPRSIYPYWREIWLERVGDAPAPPSPSDQALRRSAAVAARNAARTGSHFGERPSAANLGKPNKPHHLSALGHPPHAQPPVGAGEDELVKEVGLPAPDRRLGHELRATARSKISWIARIVPGFHIPSVMAPSWIVYAQVVGHAPYAVAGEQPDPHVGVGGLTHAHVEQPGAFEGGAVHDHRGLPHEGRVAQQASKRFRRLEDAHGGMTAGAEQRLRSTIRTPNNMTRHPVRYDGSRPASRSRPRAIENRRRAAARSARRWRARWPVQVLDQGKWGRSRCTGAGRARLPGAARQPAGCVVVRSVGHGDLDLLGYGCGRLDDRPEGTLEERGPVARGHRNRQHRRWPAGRPLGPATGRIERQDRLTSLSDELEELMAYGR